MCSPKCYTGRLPYRNSYPQLRVKTEKDYNAVNMDGRLAAPGDLKELLSPSLLWFIVEKRLPYSKTDPIDFAEFGRSIFLEAGNFSSLVRDSVWPVLTALSNIGLDNMPDLSRCLPPPSDPSYPEQCLGLQLLLDHCPRMLLRGVDQRWTHAYFGLVSQRLARTWHALPPHERPDSWARWRKTVSLDYWIAVRFWLATPFVHSELADDQEISVEFTEETRVVVERESGIEDPYRAQRKAILADLYGFPRVHHAGPPQGEGVTRESWTFWMTMLMDIHKPIIDRYGRYPYRNAICGRDSTTEEREWAKNTGHFAEASEEVARKIKQDVEQGRWTPLGQGSQKP